MYCSALYPPVLYCMYSILYFVFLFSLSISFIGYTINMFSKLKNYTVYQISTSNIGTRKQTIRPVGCQVPGCRCQDAGGGGGHGPNQSKKEHFLPSSTDHLLVLTYYVLSHIQDDASHLPIVLENLLVNPHCMLGDNN